MRLEVRWLATLVLVALLLSGNRGEAAATDGGTWQVVLAAGDDEQPVFDDATRTLAKRFRAAGIPAQNIHRLSASAPELPPPGAPLPASTLPDGSHAYPLTPSDAIVAVDPT